MEICNLKDEEDLDNFRSNFLVYFKPKKFNNQLIRELFNSELYKDLFYYFLNNGALEWLNQSAVSNKDAHK